MKLTNLEKKIWRLQNKVNLEFNNQEFTIKK
jgi:hypothetical protein